MKTIEEKIYKKEKELEKLKQEKRWCEIKKAIELVGEIWQEVHSIKMNWKEQEKHHLFNPDINEKHGIKETVKNKCFIYDKIDRFEYDLTIPQHITGAITHLESMKGGKQTAVFVKIIDKLKKKGTK